MPVKSTLQSKYIFLQIILYFQSRMFSLHFFSALDHMIFIVSFHIPSFRVFRCRHLPKNFSSFVHDENWTIFVCSVSGEIPLVRVRNPWGNETGKVPLFNKPKNQCCGSMTFWCGSGSADPCLWLMDPDSEADPSIFIIDQQKTPLKNKIFCILLFDGNFTSFSKIKSQKEVTKQ